MRSRGGSGVKCAMRNATRHTYDEAKAAEVAAGVEGFASGAAQLLAELESSLAR